LTHAFQHNPTHIKSINKNGDEEVKKSIRKLVNDYYQSPIIEILGKHPLRPSDLSNNQTLKKDFVKRCIDFQNNILSKPIKDNDTIKYFEGLSDTELKPYAIVPPYFYLDEINIDDWLPLNIDLANIATTDYHDNCNRIFCSIVLSQDILLDEKLIQRIAHVYSNLKIDGLLIWVDNFNEQQAEKVKLHSLLKLVKLLKERKSDLEIINLHGGYFSILAAGKNLFTGISHGPEFGEYRSVVPVGGGIPIAKYYIPDLHNRVKYKDAQNIFYSLDYLNDIKKFYENVCFCSECKEVLLNDPANFTIYGDSNIKLVHTKYGATRREYPKTETKKHCLKHYLNIKNKEYTDVEKSDFNGLLNGLIEGYDKYSKNLDNSEIGYLKRWEEVLR